MQMWWRHNTSLRLLISSAHLYGNLISSRTAVEIRIYYLVLGNGLRGAAGRVAKTPDSSSAAPLLLIASVWRLIYSLWICVHGDSQSYWLTRLGDKASRKNPFRRLFSVRFRDCGWICENNIHRLCQFVNSENFALICFLCIICKF